MEERGGYSGPDLYPRTLSPVKRYRRTLDEHEESQQPHLQHREAKRNNMKEEASTQSVTSSSTSVLARSPQSAPGGTASDTTSNLSAPHNLEQSFTHRVSAQPTILTPKTLFCLWGITTGEQAMEVSKTGASLVQIYTGMPDPDFRALSTTDEHHSPCLRWCGSCNGCETEYEAPHTYGT